MTAQQPEELRATRAVPLAPAWHTALLVGVIVAVAVTGSLLSAAGKAGLANAAAPRVSPIAEVYLPTFVVQCMLFAYVAWFGRERSALGALLGARWHSARRALEDVAIALGAWLLVVAVEIAWSAVFGGGTSASVAQMLPVSVAERTAWGVLAITVGISEELVYRGYLRVQLAAWLQSEPLGVLAQAVLFGVAHLQQGVGSATRIALYGVLLGAIASRRKSLVACILCHAWTDLASGVVLR